MFWDSYLTVYTPRGVFELVLRDRFRRPSSSGRRVATQEETERAWFFLRYELEQPNWSELGPVLNLYAELTGERIAFTGHAADYALMQRVREALVLALRSGELQFEEVPQPEPLEAPEVEYIRLPPDDPLSRPARPREEPHWIEFELRDQDGEPVPGQPFRILQRDRVVGQGRTDQQGWGGAEGIAPETPTIVFDGMEELAWNYQPPLPGQLIVGSAEPVTAPEPFAPVQSAAACKPPGMPPPGVDNETVKFELCLVDQVGTPLSDVEVAFSHAGAGGSATTDASGVAHYEGAGPPSAEASISNLEALRAKLKAHWDTPGEVAYEDWVKAEAGVDVIPLTSSCTLDVISLEPDQQHKVSLQPPVQLARIVGAYFDTNKCFLLPTALPHIRTIKSLYDKHPDSVLLIIGHTDTTSDPATNDPLSLERADSMAAFLSDNVEAWLAWYDSAKPEGKRWGGAEDKLMIQSLPDYRSKPPEEDRVEWFQRTRGLQVDGIAGPQTRTQLITEYMDHDGTTLPAGVEVVTHGCGENFPLPEPPPEDQAAWDRHSEIEDRRVEFIFFDKAFGIQPAPPGQNSAAGAPEYPEWVRRAAVKKDLFADGVSKEVTILEMHDALFRTNSAVVLPEGEDPTSEQDGHLSLTTVGLVATVLRYNEEHPGKKILVAGHCDTTASVEFNQPLSEERAQVALALIKGDKDAFIERCNERNDEVDVTQIFDWTTRAYGFSCKPTTLDRPPSDTRYHQFRVSYNEWLDARDPSEEPDPRGEEQISIWGRLDPTVWGAIFDLYEHNLRTELGENGAGVAALRGKLAWVDSGQPWRGYSEHFPVDNLGRDSYRSQANRRVEVLFFDRGEEPDLSLEEENSEMSDIYLPGEYERVHLEPMLGAVPYRVWVTDEVDEPLRDLPVAFRFGGDEVHATTDVEGRATAHGPLSDEASVAGVQLSDLTVALDGRDPSLRRGAEYPATPETRVVSPADFTHGVPIRRKAEHHILVVARSHVQHSPLGTPWKELSLQEPGPWSLEHDETTRVGMLGHGSGAEIDVQQEEQYSWIRAVQDAVHEAVLHEQWPTAWEFLRSIPLELERDEPPGPEEDPDSPEEVAELLGDVPFDDVDDLEQV